MLGTGVAFSTWIIVNILGICPSRAPAIKSLDAVKSVPFTPPNVEQATNIDIIHASFPYNRLENVMATASDPSTSDTESVVWNETIVST